MEEIIKVDAVIEALNCCWCSQRCHLNVKPLTFHAHVLQRMQFLFPSRTRGRNTSRMTPACCSLGQLWTSCPDRGPSIRYGNKSKPQAQSSQRAGCVPTWLKVTFKSHISFFLPVKYEPGVLEACMNLLQVSPQHQQNRKMDYLERNNPVYIGRVVSAMVRTQPEHLKIGIKHLLFCIFSSSLSENSSITAAY